MLTDIGMPAKIMAIIRQFYDGMTAWVHLDKGMCSEWFEVEQGPRQGCVPTLLVLLSNIFFTAVLMMAYKRH